MKRHIWSICRNIDNNEHGFVHLSSVTSNFLLNACRKIQNMAFETSKMDQMDLIALEYWYYGFLGRLRVDRRGFLHQRPILHWSWKKVLNTRNQDAAHVEKRVTVTLIPFHRMFVCLFIEFFLVIGSCVSTPERPFFPVFDLSKIFSGHLFV